MLDGFKQSLTDLDNPCLQTFLDSMIMNCSSNSVASNFDNYILDTLNKNMKLKIYKDKRDFPSNAWYNDKS